MSLAAETRRAIETYPFLVTALRADVVNFTAAARFLEVDGEIEAVAAALRRYADDLPPLETHARESRVTMQSGLGPVENDEDALLVVGETKLGGGDGNSTGILATGDVDARSFATALHAITQDDVTVHAAGIAYETMIVVVDRLAGANAVRAIERVLEHVPEPF